VKPIYLVISNLQQQKELGTDSVNGLGDVRKNGHREGVDAPDHVRRALAEQSQCQPVPASVEPQARGKQTSWIAVESEAMEQRTSLVVQFVSSPRERVSMRLRPSTIHFCQPAASRVAALCISQRLNGRAGLRSLDTAIRRMFK